MGIKSFVFLVCFGAVAAQDPVGIYQPWGVHIAYGIDPTTTMQVMWSTRAYVPSSIVHLGQSQTNLSTIFYGNTHNFTDVNNTQFIHHVSMQGLKAATKYYYQVGDGHSANTSAILSFQTAKADNSPVTFAIFGDFGIDGNAHDTLPLLTKDAVSGEIDIVLHIGDIAYDLDSNNGANGDTFMVNAQPYSAYLPTHYCPGNHESAEDFTQYINRFDMMPGNNTGNSAYHSFEVGQTHVTLFSSEAYFWLSPHGLALLPQQYAWIQDDLASVDRTKTPWLITMAHRPLYCSPNDDSDDCHSLLSVLRDGILGDFGMEKLLYQYGVDMHFGAHEHSYERNYPVYQFMWNENVTGPAAYVDYDRPIHILSGAAGCPENQDPWQTDGNPFSALRLNVYGYGRLHVLNTTHALWEFIDDANGTVVDSLYVVQHNHGPYKSGLYNVSESERVAAYEATMEHIRNTATGEKSGRSHVHPLLSHPSRHAPEVPDTMLRRIAEHNLRRH